MGLLSTTAAAVNAATKLLFGSNTNGDVFPAHVPVNSSGTEIAVATDASVLALLAAERPYQGVIPMTVGTAIAAQRAVRIICTVAGNVSLTYTDGSTDIIPVPVGCSYISGAITTVNSTGTTATATYANMK